MRKSRLRWRVFLAACLGAVPAAGGCAPVLLATGAVAGYALSRDSVILDFDRPWESVWSAAQQETQETGILKREDPHRGRLDARVQDVDVVVVLKRINPKTVRLVVRARKNLLPKVQVAQQLAFGIQRRMERASRIF